MSRNLMRQRPSIIGTALAMCIAASASHAVNAATTTTIYKCFDRDLGVLFTDMPCSGEQVQIRAGDADPKAVEALQRERDAVSRSAELRIIDGRRAAWQQDIARPWMVTPPISADATGYADGPAYVPYGYGFGGYGSYGGERRSFDGDRRGHRRGDSQRVVPAPPGRLIQR
jgi:hypothetical protein